MESCFVIPYHSSKRFFPKLLGSLSTCPATTHDKYRDMQIFLWEKTSYSCFGENSPLRLFTITSAECLVRSPLITLMMQFLTLKQPRNITPGWYSKFGTIPSCLGITLGWALWCRTLLSSSELSWSIDWNSWSPSDDDRVLKLLNWISPRSALPFCWDSLSVIIGNV